MLDIFQFREPCPLDRNRDRVLAHININSIRNEFDTLVQQITNNIDILMISETKLDNSFPEGQFLIPG